MCFISPVDILKYCKMVVTRSETFFDARNTPALIQADEQKKGNEFNGTQQIFMQIVYVIQSSGV